MYQLWEDRVYSSCGTEQETRAGCDWKGALHLGPVLTVYMPPRSPACALSFTVAAKSRGLPVVIREQREERSSNTRGGKRMESVFFGSETVANGPKRQTMLGMKE